MFIRTKKIPIHFFTPQRKQDLGLYWDRAGARNSIWCPTSMSGPQVHGPSPAASESALAASCSGNTERGKDPR